MLLASVVRADPESDSEAVPAADFEELARRSWYHEWDDGLLDYLVPVFELIADAIDDCPANELVQLHKRPDVAGVLEVCQLDTRRGLLLFDACRIAEYYDLDELVEIAKDDEHDPLTSAPDVSFESSEWSSTDPHWKAKLLRAAIEEAIAMRISNVAIRGFSCITADDLGNGMTEIVRSMGLTWECTPRELLEAATALCRTGGAPKRPEGVRPE